MADGDRTERATPRRREKAREQGRVARSRELGGALTGFAGLLVVLWTSAGELQRWRQSWRSWTELAWQSDFSAGTPLLAWTAVAALRWIVVPLGLVWALAVASSVAQGGFVFSAQALTPDIARMSPVKKLGQMFSLAGLAPVTKSLLPFSVLLYLGMAVLARDRELLTGSARMPVAMLATLAYQDALEICWKSTLVLLLWSGIDYLLQRQKLERNLRMSRQELRDEYRETEGNPTVKARLRRLQRQMRRRRMLKEVERATVVITNPTHFAVALEYTPQMAAPMVVAKGLNALAEQIKQVARWHEIPIAENPPLAQALYRSVEIGQTIPAKLYAAVAEILAFIYRAQMRAQQAAGRT
ncbi:MAG TPA: EscU/YscU/HrcU family type III secretion system export apparatus switch protein [Candidatus Binatia bacterium]|nr:EscU/YscU/HrcU family type III secretion system export apparatus switch protein [Candidatus Binatia bacterium]